MLPDGSARARGAARPARRCARRGGAGDPVDATSSTRRRRTAACLADAITPALAGDRPGRGREGVVRQRDLRRGAVRDRPGPAGRRAVRARAPDGLPRAAGPRPGGRRRRAGSRAPTPASPTTTPRRRRSSTCSRATTRPTTCPPSHAPAAAAARLAASPTTSSRSTRSLRFANRTRKRYPRPAAGAPARRLRPPARRRTSRDERERLLRAIHAWFDHYLRDARARRRAGRHRVRPDLPARRAAAAAVPRRRPSPRSRAARSRLRWRRAADDRAPSGGDPDDRRRRSTRPPAAATAASRSTPARRAGHRRLRADRSRAGRGAHADRRADGRAPSSRSDGAAPDDAADRGAALGRRPRRPRQRLVARGLYRPAAQGARRLPAAPGRLDASQPGHRSSSSCSAPTRPTRARRTAAFEIEVERLRLRLPVRQRPDCGQVQRAGPHAAAAPASAARAGRGAQAAAPLQGARRSRCE